MTILQAGRLRGAEMRRLRRQLRLTRWGIWAEQVARAFWPVFVILCLATALALFGAFAALGPTGHRVLLGLFGLALVAALILGGARFRRPDDAAVRARLDSSDPRRPLATLEDELAVGRGSAPSESVWRAHRRRAAEAAIRLTAGWPELRLAPRDRWALRLFAPVLLIAGLIGTGGDWPGRLATIATPAPLGPHSAAPADAQPMAEAWATPPAYTGLGTVYLKHEEDESGAFRLPQGSELTIRVTDAGGAPTLAGGEIAGISAFQGLGGGLAEATGVVAGSGELVVGGPDGELARWRVEMIPDAPPKIALDGMPMATATRALEIGFSASDDYGVVSAWAEMAPEGHDPKTARGLPLPVISFGLPLPISGSTADVADKAIRDLTAHPWAGAEVMLTLFAEDGAGQVVSTEPIRMTIPDRRFTDPMARALVEQRREIALDYGQALRVLDVLQAVTRLPDRIFEDPGVYLIVRSAIRRLASGIGSATVPAAAPEVVELLWAAALALEDGDLSAALERLRQAQEDLRQALESGSEEDIRRAMDELRAAMDQYLQQLAQQPPQPGQQGPMPDQMLSQQDLQDMLDQMQRQAESGLRDQARDMLSQLQQMLENLQAMQGGRQPGPGQQAMQELQDMIQQQRDLSDRTFDELRQRRREMPGQGMPGQRAMPGQEPGWGEGQGRGDEHGRQGQGGRGENGDTEGQSQGEGFGERQGRSGQGGGLAGEQEALRQQLDELARRLGGSDEAARALEEAARAMGQARDNLEGGENSEAVRDQMDALDRMNDGAEALAQEMQNGQGQANAQGQRRGLGQGRDQEASDPFDRPTSSYGALDGRSTRVPDQALIDRAREILRELRRRAAETTRPEMELDYLDRLLDQF